MLKIDQELKSQVDQSCRTADEFTKLYYEHVDKKRHQMSRLYLDNGTLTWCGNGSVGKDTIQKYFQELPVTNHQIVTLDAQPIVIDSTASQPTYIVQVGGNVKFNTLSMKPFQQTFIITAQGDKWKIATDCFRLQEYVITQKP